MARKLRLEYPGALYHVINRGNYRRDLFESASTGEAFLDALAEAVRRFRWRLHAYVLMCNHFHLAVETPEPNLIDGMHWLQSTVATRFNRFRKESGHLFQGRYQSIVLEDFASLARVVDYIHLNPVRARVVEVEHLCGYRWSSLFRYLRGTRFPGMMAEDWLRARGNWSDDTDGWKAYRDHLLALASDEAAQERDGLQGLSRGWAIGTAGWKKAIGKEHAHLKLTTGMEREQIRELKQAAWERRLDEVLSTSRKNRADLETRPLVVDWKLAVARELRDAGVAITWLAGHLHLGKPSSVRSLLSRARHARNQHSAA
jgi:putative transposase